MATLLGHRISRIDGELPRPREETVLDWPGLGTAGVLGAHSEGFISRFPCIAPGLVLSGVALPALPDLVQSGRCCLARPCYIQTFRC